MSKTQFPVTPPPVKGGNKEVAAPGKTFKEVLSGQLPLRFSAHAQQRMELRNIKLSPEDLSRINQMIDRAASKGARDSLLLMDNLALVVSIKNRVVITAVDGSNIKENVFTNIDSAVIV
ncbi:MAG: hypothetical protein HYU64_17885 [Armatimonadetes bacterium]|nr:hypothetical protein [Armatimonadota bacterium]